MPTQAPSLTDYPMIQISDVHPVGTRVLILWHNDTPSKGVVIGHRESAYGNLGTLCIVRTDYGNICNGLTMKEMALDTEASV